MYAGIHIVKNAPRTTERMAQYIADYAPTQVIPIFGPNQAANNPTLIDDVYSPLVSGGVLAGAAVFDADISQVVLNWNRSSGVDNLQTSDLNMRDACNI